MWKAIGLKAMRSPDRADGDCESPSWARSAPGAPEALREFRAFPVRKMPPQCPILDSHLLPLGVLELAFYIGEALKGPAIVISTEQADLLQSLSFGPAPDGSRAFVMKNVLADVLANLGDQLRVV